MARRAGAVRVDAGPRGVAVTFDPEAAARLREAGDGIAGFRWKENRLVSDRPGTDGGVEALIELFEGIDRL
jgi:hypothetical protein